MLCLPGLIYGLKVLSPNPPAQEFGVMLAVFAMRGLTLGLLGLPASLRLVRQGRERVRESAGWEEP